MSRYTHLEIATEIAWQVGDSLVNSPRSESRWFICNLADQVIRAGIISEDSEDIDEIINHWLINAKVLKGENHV